MPANGHPMNNRGRGLVAGHVNQSLEHIGNGVDSVQEDDAVDRDTGGKVGRKRHQVPSAGDSGRTKAQQHYRSHKGGHGNGVQVHLIHGRREQELEGA